jgi:hypothetical protein
VDVLSPIFAEQSEQVATVAAGTALTFASLDPAVIRTAWAEPQRTMPLPVLTHINAVMAGLAELRDRVQFPGVNLAEAEFSADGRSVTLTAWSVRELSNWYDAHRCRASASVSGRDERRADGQLYALGGLDWVLSLGDVPGVPGVSVTVWTESGEDEVLPDTALVRAMCPWASVRAAAGSVVAA